MKMPDEIRKALCLLENECNNHIKCEDCPLYAHHGCILSSSTPIEWRLTHAGTQD